MRKTLVVCASLVLAGCGAGAAGQGGWGKGEYMVAHYESPPDRLNTLPPCDSANPVPEIGVCRGTGHSTLPTTITGDWNGQSEYEYGWLTLPSGVTHGVNLETFTGRVKGCGDGSMTYKMYGADDGHGNLQWEWEVIEGLGTGELAAVQGHGTVSGVVRDDLSSAGEFRGWLRCSQRSQVGLQNGLVPGRMD